jgi:hypothetical protein
VAVENHASSKVADTQLADALRALTQRRTGALSEEREQLRLHKQTKFNFVQNICSFFVLF